MSDDPPVTIPYGRQCLDESDIEAVVAVLRGDWLTQGPEGPAFEAALCDRTGARHAVAFANGSVALTAACAAAGLGPGHRVATSTLSFVASAACARAVGAEPVLCDIDPATLNLDPEAVPGDVDALVAVHYAGLPLDLGALRRRPGVVIEDAAHALGAAVGGAPVGRCDHSDLCCFSFHPVKAVTTGEGGAVTTNSDELAARLRRLRHHAIVRRPEVAGFAYDVGELGFNFRLTDFQAALGRSQLRKLDAFVGRRAELAARYRRLLDGADLELPPDARPGDTHAHHLFAVRLEGRDRCYAALRRRGIGVQVHYPLIHRLSAYAGGPPLPRAERAGDRLLSLPLFPTLTEAEQDRVVEALTGAW